MFFLLLLQQLFPPSFLDDFPDLELRHYTDECNDDNGSDLDPNPTCDRICDGEDRKKVAIECCYMSIMGSSH